jgi:hypothetical protein
MHEYGILVPAIVWPLSQQEQDTFDAKLADTLLAAFGGFTKVPGLQGAWRGPDGKLYLDAIVEYRIGISGLLRTAHNKAREVAYTIGRDLGEKAMYLRCPNGKVEIISTL